MKINWKDIAKFIKGTLMVLALVLCLSACTTDKGEMTASNTEGKQAELDEQQRTCWQANLLEMFYNAMSESSMKAYPKVTKSAMSFMMVAFAIWLSIRILKHLSSLVEESPAEVWTEVGRMAFLCLFCGLLASSTEFLLFALNKFIFPVYYAFLEFGSRILELTATGENADIKGQVIGKRCLFYTNSLICKAPSIDPISASSLKFPSGPADLMQCLVCAISDRLQLGFVMAKELLSAANFTSIIIGIVIYCIFILVKVSFVFYIVDTIFRMNIVVIILPFLILAIPFKSTRGWAKEGALTIFNSAACVMCIAIIATMAMLAMQYLINDNAANFGDSGMYLEFGPVPLSILLISFLILKSSGIAVALAGSLVGGGGGTNFQKKIAKLAAFAAKKLFTFITSGAGKVVTSVIDKHEKLREARDKVKKARQKVESTLNRLAGRDK